MCACVWSDDDGVRENLRSGQEMTILTLCARNTLWMQSRPLLILGLWKLVAL